MPSLFPIATTASTFTRLRFSRQPYRSRWTDDGACDAAVHRICASQRQPPLPRRRRVARYLLGTPRRLQLYFRNRPVRRWSWRFISLGVGYLVGNTVSLTFGTLAVNDVLAAILTVGFYVGVSNIYWNAKRKTYPLQLLNFFKNGVTLALLSDAFKLSC